MEHSKRAKWRGMERSLAVWCYSLAMSHKDELLKRARVLRSQSEGRGPTKRSLRQLADSYQREAERLSDRPGSNVTKPHRAAWLSI